MNYIILTNQINYIMRKLFMLIGIAVITCIASNAQGDVSLTSTRFNEMNARKFLRPSLSKIYLMNCAEAKQGAKAFDEEEDLRFDVNNVDPRFFMIGSFGESKEQRDSIIRANINHIIVDNKLGNQIMKNWFPKFDEQEGYTSEMLLQRGEWGATDQDIMQMGASARQSLLYELGEQLIDRSYVMFVGVEASSHTNKNGETRWTYSYYPYIYKLDFSDEVRTNFYTNFYNIANGIDNAEFPVNFIYTPNKSCDDLYEVYSRCRSVSDFQVKASVAEVHPIRAKIGKKEGLHVDDRYLVLENRLREDGSQDVHKVSVVRCKHVGDNNTFATGETEDLSSFYTIKGGRARQGLHYLAEYRDMGMAIAPIINIADVGLQYNFSLARATRIPGVSAFLKAGLVMGDDFKPLMIQQVDKDGKLTDAIVLKVGLGLEKEFNIAHHFVLTPSIGGGALLPVGGKYPITGLRESNNTYYYTYDTDAKFTDVVDTYYLEGSLKLGFMINYHIQLYVEGGYSHYFLGDNFKYGQLFRALDKKKDEIVDPQKFRAGIGLKFYW